MAACALLGPVSSGTITGGVRWQGMAAIQTDANFVQFTGPRWDIRAIADVLITHQDKRRLVPVLEDHYFPSRTSIDTPNCVEGTNQISTGHRLNAIYDALFSDRRR